MASMRGTVPKSDHDTSPVAHQARTERRAVVPPVSALEVYTLREAARRLGIGRAALMRMRRQGLRVADTGARVYVLGSEIIRFLRGISRPGVSGARAHSEASRRANSVRQTLARRKANGNGAQPGDGNHGLQGGE